LFIKKIESITNIPIVVHGGAGNINQILNLFKETQCDGVSISSLFHYYYIFKFNNESSNKYLDEGNIDFLMSKSSSKKIESTKINKLKKFLLKKRINCRI